MKYDHQHQGEDPAHQADARGAGGVPEQYIDPVCGMTVSADSKHFAEHDGERFFFCSAGCPTKFLVDPKHYLEAQTDTRPRQVSDA